MFITGDKGVTVLGKGHAGEGGNLAVKDGAARFFLDIPELDASVAERRRRHQLAVGGKGHGKNHVLVPVQDGTLPRVFHVPEPHGLILSAGCQDPSAWRKRQRGDGAPMTFQR